MNNIGFPPPEWTDLPPGSLQPLSGSEQAFIQSKGSLPPSLQSAESMSKSSPLTEAQFSTIPGLVPPQALRLTEDKPEEILSNVLDSTIEVLEETLHLLSDEKVQPQPFTQQTASPATIPVGQFLSVILAAMRELKQVRTEVEMNYAAKVAAIRVALSELSTLQDPTENMGKLLLMTELIQLKSEARYIPTGKRVILGEHPGIMLKLVEYGVIPPTVTGGPYDGMAKKYAEQGRPPYDNPAYAAMAKSLPAGWEELSIGELDQVISQLQESMAPPLSNTTSFGLLSTVMSESLSEGANLIGSFTRSVPNLMQMLTVRMQLENLKESDRKGDHVVLGNHPELLATLMATNSAPNPYLEFGNPNFGMAQKAALEHKPPYDNPVYATIAFNYPPGWESVSLKELDRITQRLDGAIAGAINSARGLSAYSPHALIEPFRSNSLALLTLSQFGSTEILPFGDRSFLFPPPSARDVANMLLDSVAMFQSFYWNVHPFQFLNPNQMGEHLLGFWLTQNIASRMTQDLFGYQLTSPFEREMMTRAIVSYALVGTLINTYRMSDIGTLNVLNALTKNDRFAMYAGVAIVMIENYRQGEIQALQSTIRALTKQLEQDEEQLENIKTLEALLKQMLAQIFQMLTQNANAEGSQMGQAKREEPPPFVNLQG